MSPEHPRTDQATPPAQSAQNPLADHNPAAGLDPLDMPPMPVEHKPEADGAKAKQMQLIAIGVGVLAFFLLITTIVFSMSSSKYQKQSTTAYNDGMETGKKEQKETDTATFNKELTSSTRTYVAPVINGSFEISYPKAWSLSVDTSSSTPVAGLINPSFVTVQAPEQALRFTLIDTPYASTKKRYDDSTKTYKAKATEVTVSGIKGVQYVGNINDKSKTAVGTVVILPLRDKTMLLQTDNNKVYGDTYKQMLDTAKFIP